MPHPHTQSLQPADSELLDTLAETAPEYPTVAASRCLVPEGEAKERCERLAAAGLLERITAEPVYRVTDDGRSLLATVDVACSVTGD